MTKCNICNCEYEHDLHRTGLLNLRGSEDDYICNRCKCEISKFAHSMRRISEMVRGSEIIKKLEVI